MANISRNLILLNSKANPYLNNHKAPFTLHSHLHATWSKRMYISLLHNYKICWFDLNTEHMLLSA